MILKDMSNSNQQHPHYESPISQHWLLLCLFFLLFLAAFLVVYFINIPIWSKTLIGFFIITRSYYIWRAKKRNLFQRLVYRNQSWFLLDVNAIPSEYKLDKLSKVLNIVYVLNLREVSTSDSTQLIVWKRDMPEAFARFLSQVYQFGLPSKE